MRPDVGIANDYRCDADIAMKVVRLGIVEWSCIITSRQSSQLLMHLLLLPGSIVKNVGWRRVAKTAACKAATFWKHRRCESCSHDQHLWWNWYTHNLEVVAPKGMRVRISPDAPKIYGHVAQMAVGGTFRVFVVQVRILSWLPILMPWYASNWPRLNSKFGSLTTKK